MVNKYNLQETVHFQRLYAIRSSFVPAYYMHCLYPFLQSTQRSEGFNAVLKKYVNPNMSVLNFVKQYQKIQDKCLVAQDGQDFRTEDKERRRWSRYPIEKHASAVYTKNLFYRFSKEFEKTAEYDVTPEGQFQYWLVPNKKIVYGYGKRKYLVTAAVEEESYYCECSKFDRDGMICCHIMKILTRLGVKNIPQRYILKRWTQEAIPENENTEPNAHVPADFIARGMPLNNKRTLWSTNLSTTFASLAVEGCVSKETYTVMDNHIKLMLAEIGEIKKRRKSKARRARGANQASSVHNDGANVADNMTITAPSDTQTGSDPIVQIISADHDAIAAENTGGLPPFPAGDGPVSVPGELDGAGAISTGVGNPPRSKVKGRKKEKRFKKGMNAGSKRKNKCGICKMTGHNAAKCSNRMDGVVKSGPVAVE
ncbi:hypothetical protein C2845_PM07G17900 [Panicum miliaceum]|uniref:Protein FAR1-RELATED SEQUENCE n=1 Tax=Panicum miliaceum TaxID=4540 RepID=A0A3L6SNF2_PANMI|nr:hypothetical protein C2845_PM07G17900 [Panicum miliaceum]